MAGRNPRFLEGPISYPVDPSVVAGPHTGGIAGGMLVQPHAGTAQGAGMAPTVEPATAGSIAVLGVSENDGAPAGSDSATDLSARPAFVTVHHGVVIDVQFAASSVAGAYLKAAASGQVTPWISGTDNASLIVGRTFESAVASTAFGLAIISPVGSVL